ncbi:NYN domain-containing protein [Phycisphaerales bacterium AB-hyl4]|uniref:NYN domain-containing protein n=1 Tax=Natronomicrosphaera hydrolytica TaxID=3242702 RepID=A0ABV4U4P8_9BACT
MTTYVYIDGFNFYYGAIRSTRTHWLNLNKFVARLNGGAVDKIKFCTAMVSDTSNDSQKSVRQQTYHQALTSLPNVEIILGHFRTHGVAKPVHQCGNSPLCFVQVSIREEKGSDVNLASHLIHDAHLGMFDKAIVISGDSDLAEPVRIVAHELHKRVIVFNPRQVGSRELQAAATQYRTIRPNVLGQCQFPQEVQLPDATTVHCPREWIPGYPRQQLQPRVRVACDDCQVTIRTHRRPVGS